MTSSNPARKATLVALPTLVVALLGPLPLLLWRDRLPDPLASHWGTSGPPDGSASHRILLIAGWAAVVLTAAVMTWAVTATRPRAPMLAPLIVFATVFTTGIVAAASASIVAINLDVVDWRDAAPLPWWHIVAVVAVPSLLGGGAVRAVAGSAPAEPVAVAAPPAHPLPAGERTVWVQSLMNPWLLAPSALLVVLGLAGVLFPPLRFLAVWLVVAGVVTSTLSSVRVTVDRRGLEVAFGPLRWPRVRIPAERIETADVIEILPRQWGGWGYRGSLRLMKRAAVVLRRGPGLHLRLRNGSEFAVTIPDPHPGADLMNRVVASTPGTGDRSL